MFDWTEIILRLGAATLAGGAIGLNRDLHGKPIGLRTLAIVGLATASIVLVAVPSDLAVHFTDATSRVVQGILTGIGFLGAGVIIHGEATKRVKGLTSAACTWLTACIGILCGCGQYAVVLVTLVMAFIVLMLGHRVERTVHHALGGRDDDQSSDAGPHQPGR